MQLLLSNLRVDFQQFQMHLLCFSLKKVSVFFLSLSCAFQLLEEGGREYREVCGDSGAAGDQQRWDCDASADDQLLWETDRGVLAVLCLSSPVQNTCLSLLLCHAGWADLHSLGLGGRWFLRIWGSLEHWCCHLEITVWSNSSWLLFLQFSSVFHVYEYCLTILFVGLFFQSEFSIRKSVILSETLSTSFCSHFVVGILHRAKFSAYTCLSCV